MKKVLILVNSESSKHIADRAIEVLDKYSIPYQLEVISALKQQIQGIYKGLPPGIQKHKCSWFTGAIG